MLVITRKAGERINLGEDIIVTVLEVSGSSVRIGIEAPADVRIFRHEIWEAAAQENRAAAEASVDDLPSPKHTTS
jgi:carbon storage regulator